MKNEKIIMTIKLNNPVKFGLILSLLFLCLLVLPGTSICKNDPPRAIKGVLDLSDWDFEKDGNIYLVGEWEFYWKKFVSYDDVRQGTFKPDYIKLPGRWNNMDINGAKLPAEGYGSFRLRIKLNKSNEAMAFQFYPYNNQIRLFVDQELITTIGKPDSIKEASSFVLNPHVASFQNSTQEFDIIIHTGIYFRGKYFDSPPVLMGYECNINNKQQKRIYIICSFLGCYLSIAILFIVFYFIMKQRNTIFLYVSLCCISMASWSLFDPNYYILYLFPNANSELIVTLSGMILCLGLFSLTSFLKIIFPRESNNKLNILIYSLLSIIVIKVVFVSYLTSDFIYYTLYFEYPTVGIIVFNWFLTLSKAIKNKRSYAMSYLICFINFSITILHNCIDYIIPLGDEIPLIGWFSFILLQGFIVGKQHFQSIVNESLLKEKLMRKEIKISRLTGKDVRFSQDLIKAVCQPLGITVREQEIVYLMLSDFSNKEIANKLFISPSTVRKHINNLYRKVDVNDRDSLYVFLTKQLD